MKKLSTLLVVMLLVFSLVACGGGTTTTPAPTTGGTTPAPAEGSDIKAALLVGALGDMSFNDSAHSGMQRAGADLGIEVKTIEYGHQQDKFEATLIDTAEQGYNVILTSSTLQDAIEANAEDFPETVFVMFDGEVDWAAGDFKNVYCITYKANEASYLGGYVAAAMSETGVIGFLGGTDQPIINDFLLGYIGGAQAKNPDIKVITTYAGSYSDPSKGKELTLGMINQNADVLFNVAGGTGVGLIEAAVEKGKYILGVDSDQALMYEATGKQNFADLIPTSVLKNVGDSLYRTLDLYKKGELKVGEAEVLGIAEGGVGIADNKYYQEMVPKEVREEVSALQEKILAGEVQIDTAYGKTTEQIAEIREAVKP